MPFDFKKFKWCDGNNFKNIIFPMDMNKLPEVINPLETLGEVTETASKATGIPAGLPVIATGSDKGCETLGLGCLKPNIVALSFGTTATVQTMTKKYTEIIPFNPPYPSVIPYTWNTEFQIYRGFWMIEWFKKEFGEKEVKKALDTGVLPEKQLNQLLKDVPAGSMGLMLQPYWTAGVKIPGPEGKGSIIGFGEVHTKSYLYRAIIEGLAYALRYGTDITEKRSKISIKEVRVAGGGSQSDSICQIMSDVFNKTVKRGSIYEATGLGNAIVGMVGMNVYKDFTTAIQNMVKLTDTFIPDKKNAEIYEKLYSKVYIKMYKRIKPLLKEIKDIVNYPCYK